MLTLVLFLLPFFPFFAFSWGVKEVIWKRDKSICVTCGKRREDGYTLQCSHYDHDKRKSHYNTPDNGRLQCLECHYEFHYTLLQVAIEADDEYYVKLHSWSCNKLLEEMERKKPEGG